jgi:hypothetical protein
MPRGVPGHFGAAHPMYIHRVAESRPAVLFWFARYDAGMPALTQPANSTMPATARTMRKAISCHLCADMSARFATSTEAAMTPLRTELRNTNGPTIDRPAENQYSPAAVNAATKTQNGAKNARYVRSRWGGTASTTANHTNKAKDPNRMRAASRWASNPGESSVARLYDG